MCTGGNDTYASTAETLRIAAQMAERWAGTLELLRIAEEDEHRAGGSRQ